jgi:hypothetical protein
VNVNVKISRGNHPVGFPQRGGPGPHPQIGGGFGGPGKGGGGRGPHKYEENEGSSSEEKEGSSSEEKEEQPSTTTSAARNAKSSAHNEWLETTTLAPEKAIENKGLIIKQHFILPAALLILSSYFCFL